jgi:hypothetical protein
MSTLEPIKEKTHPFYLTLGILSLVLNLGLIAFFVKSNTLYDFFHPLWYVYLVLILVSMGLAVAFLKMGNLKVFKVIAGAYGIFFILAGIVFYAHFFYEYLYYHDNVIKVGARPGPVWQYVGSMGTILFYAIVGMWAYRQSQPALSFRYPGIFSFGTGILCLAAAVMWALKYTLFWEGGQEIQAIRVFGEAGIFVLSVLAFWWAYDRVRRY